MIVIIIDENVSGDLEDIITDIAPAVIGPVRAEILLKLTDILTGRHKIVTPAPEGTLFGFVILSKEF